MFPLTIEEGLVVRPLEESDAEELYAAVDRNRAYLREWLPWVDGSTSAESTRDHIRQMRAQYEDHEAVGAGIWVDGRIAGAIGIHKINAANRFTSIGYWLDASQQGRGIMTKACRAMVTHAFREYGLNRVEIRCGTGNVRSCAIPERLGFVREGVLREVEWVSGRFIDLVVWSMLARDWA